MSKRPWHFIGSLLDWFDRLHRVVSWLGLGVAVGGYATFIAGLWQGLAVAEIFALSAFVALCTLLIIWLSVLIYDYLGKPKLAVDFDPQNNSCVAKVTVTPPPIPAVYVRARVIVKGRRPAKQCRGFLHS